MQLGDTGCLVCWEDPGVPVSYVAPVAEPEERLKRQRVAHDCNTTLIAAVDQIKASSKVDLQAFKETELVLHQELTAQANRMRAAYNASVRAVVKDLEVRADSAEVYAVQPGFGPLVLDTTIPVVQVRLDKADLQATLSKTWAFPATPGYSLGYKTGTRDGIVYTDSPVYSGTAASVLRCLLATPPSRWPLRNIYYLLFKNDLNACDMPAVSVYDSVADVLRRTYRDVRGVEHKEEITMEQLAARLLLRNGCVYMKEHAAPVDIAAWCQTETTIYEF